MKNIEYVIFTVLFLFLNIFYVDASCTNEEISVLKDEVKEINITYKHLGKIENDEGETYYNYFKLSATNLSDDFYVLLSKNTNKLIPEDGKIEATVYSGTWDFQVYSNKCEEKIDTIEVFIPTFNLYSLDPLCEGIDGDDFALCGKYYEYYVSYDNFVSRVNAYRVTHNINNDNSEDDENFIESVIDNILDFFINYKLYVLIVFVMIIIIIIIIIVIKKRKKRGVLS